MKEIDVSLKIAANINAMHARYASRYTLIIWLSLLALAWLICHALGKPWHLKQLQQYGSLLFTSFLFIYAIPVNMWVTRKLFRQDLFNDYRLHVVAKPEEITE